MERKVGALAALLLLLSCSSYAEQRDEEPDELYVELDWEQLEQLAGGLAEGEWERFLDFQMAAGELGEEEAEEWGEWDAWEEWKQLQGWDEDEDYDWFASAAQVSSAAEALELLRTEPWVLFVATTDTSDASWDVLELAAMTAAYSGPLVLPGGVRVVAVNLNGVARQEVAFTTALFGGLTPGALRLYRGDERLPPTGLITSLTEGCCRPAYKGEHVEHYMELCRMHCVPPQEVLELYRLEGEEDICSEGVLSRFIEDHSFGLIGIYDGPNTPAARTMLQVWGELLEEKDENEVLPWNMAFAMVEDRATALRCMEVLAPEQGLRMPLLAVRGEESFNIMGTLTAKYMKNAITEIEPVVHYLDSSRYWQLVGGPHVEKPTIILFVDPSQMDNHWALEEMREFGAVVKEAVGEQGMEFQLAYVIWGTFPRLQLAFGIGVVPNRRAVWVDHQKNRWWGCEWEGDAFEGLDLCTVAVQQGLQPPERLPAALLPPAQPGMRAIPLLTAEEVEQQLWAAPHMSLLLFVEGPGCGFCALVRNTVLAELQRRIVARKVQLPLVVASMLQLDTLLVDLPLVRPGSGRLPRLIMAAAAPPEAKSLEHSFIDLDTSFTLTNLVNFVLRTLPSSDVRERQRELLLAEEDN